MPHQELLDYINQQIQQGVSREDITKSLLTNNWQTLDIEEAFRTINIPNQINKPYTVPFVAIVIIVGVLVIGAGAMGYFAFVRNARTLPTIQKPLEKVSLQETPEQKVSKPIEKPAVSLSVSGWMKYTDPQNRFNFSYPPTFGTFSQGTDNGFGDRVAAIRFSEFSSGVQNGQIILGGEAVLTKGFVLVDIQALGGLYDSITLGVFPDTLRNNIISSLPILTATNFCGELAKEQRVDLSKSNFTSLNQQEKDVIVSMDKTRNIDPKVIRCDINGDTVTFHKEVSDEAGQFTSRQHIYGAIRFLASPFSSFQIIRTTAEPPTQEILSVITSVLKSFQ